MCRKRFLLSLVLMFGVATGVGFRFWTNPERPLADEVLTDLLPHPNDPTKLLIATKEGLFLRTKQRTWKRVFSLHTSQSPIKKLVSHPLMQDKIFLVTERGVVESSLTTGRIKWIFHEPNPARNLIYSLTLHPDNPRQLYLATHRGLFHSNDEGRSWKVSTRWPQNQRVEFVGFLPSTPRTLLLGTDRELFFSKDNGIFFESAFSLPLFPNEIPDESLEEVEEADGSRRFTSFASSSGGPMRFWVGTTEGVFESQDGGISWDRLPDRGFETKPVFDLAFSEATQTLIAMTGSGVFRFRGNERRWEKLPLGLTHLPASITIQPSPDKNQDLLFVASGNEVYEWGIESPEIVHADSLYLPSPERLELFKRLLSFEPTIREVQKEAIRYADLGNGKIKRWQWGSRLRAFIPRLTFSKDFSLNGNIDIDRGGTNDPDKFIRGPEELNRGWDLGLTWELGDMLYSTAQPSIDSRAKLLVELRDSILSEVTRIYFERRRVLMELALLPPRQTPQENFDLLLRLDELTAQLDALTNGFFSERLEVIYQNYPELNQPFSLFDVATEESPASGSPNE